MSTAAEFRQQMEEAIQSYRKAIERVKTFESKLSDARRSEAVAISDDVPLNGNAWLVLAVIVLLLQPLDRD